MSFYEFLVDIIDILLIESLSFSRRKKRAKYTALTSNNFDKNNLVANRCFNVRQFERSFFESNWNLI
jgi:hypothetical protein